MASKNVEAAAQESIIERLRRAQVMERLVGRAPSFLRVTGRIPAIARADATVLLTGETGTGKELVARAIHYLSRRAGFPFVAVNCGALPETLLEDDLFGHERGAFTDARAPRPGLLAEADQGTLFLDEVGSLTPRAQTVLLRVLHDKTWRALGSSHERRVDVRFVAATNVELRTLVQQGLFRPDLYYRLCVLWVELPALRDRREDILPLARHFATKHARGDRPPARLTPAAEQALLCFDWPGNVRELENAIIRGVSLADSEIIDAHHLGLPAAAGREAGGQTPEGAQPQSFKVMKEQMVSAFERDYLTRLMRAHAGNVTRAARAAQKERRELGKLLKKHHLKPSDFAGAR